TSPAARAALIDMIDGRPAPARPRAPFDIVDLDPAADPEAAAQRLSGQPDVAYAQARYRAHPLFKPNDPLYSLQWNFPVVDMARSWDIHPGAATSAIVAVLDSGMAYTNISFDLTQTRPQSIDGVVYPALGTVHLPFAA